ncbi:hypothetical protein JCM8202v2_000682 [Rhodotorula sphaerocarpa]
MDPFLARGSNSVPPGTYDAEPSSAPAGPAGPHASTAPSSTGGGTRAGPLFSGVPSPTTTGRTGRSTGGKSVKTPWYLTWAGIAGLVLALLVAIALGVGLGVGLGTKRSSSSGSELAAAQDGSGADPNSVTQESVTASIVTTADPATVTVPISVDVTATSVETETSYRGGSTVVISGPAAGTRTVAPIVTVSETLPPRTRVETVYRTTFLSTQTITTTLGGGAARTMTEVVTVESTVTAEATGRRMRR